jgi:putative ATPase
VRPRTLEEILGQDAALGSGTPLRRSLQAGHLPSLILWGPPGSGKTSLAHLLAATIHSRFLAHSAVLSGVREIRQVVTLAEAERQAGQRPLTLFIDEIHRFNKAQQDAFLPHVERGTLILIGATTENPSFEVNAPLLSRCRVVVLEPLSRETIRALLSRALARDAVLRDTGVTVQAEALEALAAASRGDARRALNALEEAVRAAGGGDVDPPAVEAILAQSPLLYDRSGEEHYNLLSALHKSLRNSDADAAVYWVVRMLRSGEDPLVIARRMIRFASEDVGLADAQALPLAVAARDAVHFLGLPEGGLALVEAAVYLAAAPKSNALDGAWRAVVKDLEAGHAEPVPPVLRNAPTGLMGSLGYGRGYRYAHDQDEKVAALQCLPDSVKDRRYYVPSSEGNERAIAEALAEWARRRARAGRRERSGEPPARTKPS